MMTTFRVSGIPFELSRQFRAQTLANESLVNDVWDAHAEHIGFFKDDEIVATFRLVRPWVGRLPVSEHVPELPIGELDLQVGRFAARRESWDRPTGQFFFDHYREQVVTRGSRFYVAVPAQAPAVIPIRHYEKMGFHNTGNRYYDGRYARTFYILVRSNGLTPNDASKAPRTARDPPAS